MINAIENAINAVRKAALEQSDSIVRELNSDFDSRNAALAVFNDMLKKARSLREQADSIERDACNALNSALTASGSISLSLVNQICAGEIITSTEVPSSRKITEMPVTRKVTEALPTKPPRPAKKDTTEEEAVSDDQPS